MNWRIISAAAAIIICLALYILWQSAEGRASKARLDANEAQAKLAISEKRNAILEREALQKLTDDARIDTATSELKDKIDEAAKQIPAGTVVDPASRAITCGRLQRSGQTGSAEYKRLCG